MREVNYIDYSGAGSETQVSMTNPGLIDPGVIVIGKSVQTNTGSWADGWNPMPMFEFSDTPSEFIQYKADTNKFLGYIGDLAEYGFKHIPEKFYYNNISNLELLNSDDQEYIGSKLPVLRAISDYSVFSELIGNDYKDSSSIPETNYNKFKPRYFGTSRIGDKTVMLFMVPPDYNTIFISNGSEIYSKEDYFGIYGIQIQDAAISQAYYSGIGINAPRPGTPTVIDYVIDPSLADNSYVLDNDQSMSVVELFVDSALSGDSVPGADPEPEPDTGGRGRGNGNGNTTVSVLDGNYSLVTNQDLGLTLVVPTDSITEDNYAEMNPEVLLYDHWFPSSSYTFEKFDEFKFYFKKKPSASIQHFRYFNLDGLLQNETYLKNYIIDRFNPHQDSSLNQLDVIEIETAEDGSYSIYGIYVYIYLNETYKNIRGITKYTFESDTGYNGKIYKKVLETEYGGATKPIQDVQLIQFKWDHNYNAGTGRFDSFITLPLKKSEWYIKKYKEVPNNNNNDPTPRDKSNIDIDSSTYLHNLAWDDLYGKANYFKYLDNTCQVKIRLSNDLDDYYKLVKLVISPIETQEYSLTLDSSGSVPETFRTVEPGFIFKTGYDVMRIDYVWEATENMFGGVPSFTELPASTLDDKHYIGEIIRVKNTCYRLTDYVLTKISASAGSRLTSGEYLKIGNKYFAFKAEPVKSSIESINIANLGYRTSENPLKNLDKYLVRDKTFINKYSIQDSGVIDLTSGTVVSRALREKEDESYVDYIKYSYRKTYRKGQSTLIGLPNNIEPRIIDIQQIVPSIYMEVEYLLKKSTSNSFSATLALGEIFYVGSNKVKLAGTENNYYIVSTDEDIPLGETPKTVQLGDFIKIGENCYKIYEGESSIGRDLIGSVVYDYSDGNIYKIGLEESTGFGYIEETFSRALPAKQYLYRYRGEYYLWQIDSRNNGELFRVGKLDIRTWISLVDNNKGMLPGMSRSWMSRDGVLSVGDKVWIMIISGNNQRKVIGEVVKKSSVSTSSTGTSIKIICEKLQSPVRLNGVKVNVDGTELPTEENGIKRYAYYLYLERQYNYGRRESTVIADITNNIVFKDKINYLIN